MRYTEQLKRHEWLVKRNEILKRDGEKCTNCGIDRPPLRKLDYSFGIKTMSELQEKGYVFQSDVNTLTHENIDFTKNGRNFRCKYVGSGGKTIELSSLRFAFRHLDGIQTPFGFMRGGEEMICFYEDTLSLSSFVDLNVHHKYYIKDKMAWEYDGEALISLCYDCHKKVHEEADIIVYNEVGDQLLELKFCKRCGGGGYLKQYEYFKGGVCFSCGGEGVVVT